jgi:hypothetical protein
MQTILGADGVIGRELSRSLPDRAAEKVKSAHESRGESRTEFRISGTQGFAAIALVEVTRCTL